MTAGTVHTWTTPWRGDPTVEAALGGSRAPARRLRLSSILSGMPLRPSRPLRSGGAGGAASAWRSASAKSPKSYEKMGRPKRIRTAPQPTKHRRLKFRRLFALPSALILCWTSYNLFFNVEKCTIVHRGNNGNPG